MAELVWDFGKFVVIFQEGFLRGVRMSRGSPVRVMNYEFWWMILRFLKWNNLPRTCSAIKKWTMKLAFLLFSLAAAFNFQLGLVLCTSHRARGKRHKQSHAFLPNTFLKELNWSRLIERYQLNRLLNSHFLWINRSVLLDICFEFDYFCKKI